MRLECLPRHVTQDELLRKTWNTEDTWWVPAGSLVPTYPWILWEDSHMGMPLTWGQFLWQHGHRCFSLATLIWNSCPVFKPESAPCPFWSKGQWIQQWMTRWVRPCARGWVYFYLGASSILIRFSTFIKTTTRTDEVRNHHTHNLPCTSDINPLGKHIIITS